MAWQYLLLIPTAIFHLFCSLRERNLSALSSDWRSIPAANSSHFVWTDEPEIMFDAVKRLLDR